MVNRVIRVGGCKLCFSKLKPVVFQGLAQRSIEHLGKRERIKNIYENGLENGNHIQTLFKFIAPN